jgi:signal transduction histidine kinase
MTLRNWLTVALLSLTSLVVIGAGGIIWSTTVLRTYSDSLSDDLELTRSLDEVALHVFEYRYYDRLWLSTQKAEALVHRQHVENQLGVTLQALEAEASGTPLESQVQELKDAVSLFLIELEKAHSRIPPSEADRLYQSVDPMFVDVRTRVERLIRTSMHELERSRELANQLDIQMNWVGGALATLGLLGSLGFMRLLWRQLYMPAVQLQESVQRFAQGDRAARCAVVRPAEFATVATAFNGLADRLEEQRATQLRFLGAVVHDLRNPLASMKLYCELIKPDRPMPDDGRIRKAFQVIGRQVDRLNRMTSDLLDAARIEAGDLSMTFSAVNLVDIAREVIGLFEESAANHRLSLEASSEAEVLGDPTRLYQVVTNLVSNAIKYSPHGGEVGIRLTRVRGEVELAVVDEGVGIAPEEVDRVFEPFRRSGKVKDNIPGVGLGLSVSRRIVEGHGGRILVSSEPGRGSTFTVRLPALSSEARDVPGAPLAKPAG